MRIFVYSLCTVMKIEIPTSPEAGEKIRKLFADHVLKPKNMTLKKIEAISETAILVHIDGTNIELSDLFFMGYWTNYASQLKK
jgi:DNA mismatch repair ATPase MutL